jgi:hypothetical protein
MMLLVKNVITMSRPKRIMLRRRLQRLVRRTLMPCDTGLQHSLFCGCEELKRFALFEVGRLVADHIGLAS